MVTVKFRGNEPFKTKNLKTICSAEDFYDDSSSGYKEPVEDILADYEMCFNKKMEQIREFKDNGVQSDVVVSYVAMLLDRSVKVRELIRELSPGHSESFFKDVQRELIRRGLDVFDGHPVNDYAVKLIGVTAGQEYLTTDVPVVKAKDQTGGIVHICPLSSICCAIIYLKDDLITKARINGENYTVEAINQIMCKKAYQYLFYADKISDECLSIFENNGY